jgi:hypothetical protein
MASDVRANFVDRLLARVDGELASIWITTLLTTDGRPDVEALRRGVARLVGEIDRLRLRWDERASDWVITARSDETVAAAVREWPPAASVDVTNRLVRDTVDLGRDLPLRLTVAPLTDGAFGTTLVAIQLHHSIGDARSLMHLIRRLWEVVKGAPGRGHPLGPAQLTDRRALAAALRRAPALPAIARAEHRVLARRGQALGRRDADIGRPMMLSLRAPLEGRFDAAQRSRLFFGALLAGVMAHQGNEPWTAPLRLRIPVDLRREVGIGATLENACSAVPIEVPSSLLRDALASPDSLGRLVPDALAKTLGAGVHWATLIECLVISRFASTATLRTHVRPDLLAARRANSLVTTYVGTTDRYFEAVPFPVRTLRTHTPTWGANGFTFGDALVVNLGSFEGLWTRGDLEAFVAAMSDWLHAHYALAPQVIA